MRTLRRKISKNKSGASGGNMEKEKPKPERRQTGVKLDTELLRKFRVLAAERETTLGELLEEAMRDFLAKAEKQKGR